MPKYIPVLAPFLLLFLAFPLISAWRPTDRTCGGTTICLTSFKWCEPSGARECFYPPDVYPQSNEAGQFPALVWEGQYEISWKGVRQDSGTVTVEWRFKGDGNETVVWSQGMFNFSFGLVEENTANDDSKDLAALNNNIVFKPSASMFLPTTSPEPASNITFDAAQGLVNQKSYIRIRQGGETGNSDTSDEFVVLSSVTKNIVNRAVEDEKKAWKKKMAVGLIVGILGTSGVTIAATWFWMKWWMLRMQNIRLNKKIVD
jgi:hypothetical protein